MPIHTGGSSSGSAVAVASGLADLGVGTDTSGSVRLPAAANGIWGWRPTHGVIPIDKCWPLAPSFDTVGFLAHDPHWFVKAADIFAFSPDQERKVTLLVPKPILARSSRAIQEKFLDALEHTGLTYETVELPFDLEAAERIFSTILLFEASRLNDGLLSEIGPSIDKSIVERLEQGKIINSRDYEVAGALQRELSDAFYRLLGSDSVLIFPTLAIQVPSRTATEQELKNFRFGAIRTLCIGSLTKSPQLAGPLLDHVNFRESVSLLAAPDQDRSIFRMALGIKEAIAS